MYNTSNFKENLNALKKARQCSLTEFSEALNLPTSTLQSILGSGQTSLDTACRISDAVGIPLSVPARDSFPAERFEVLHGFLVQLGWFAELGSTDQRVVADAFSVTLEVLEK